MTEVEDLLQQAVLHDVEVKRESQWHRDVEYAYAEGKTEGSKYHIELEREPLHEPQGVHRTELLDMTTKPYDLHLGGRRPRLRPRSRSMSPVRELAQEYREREPRERIQSSQVMF